MAPQKGPYQGHENCKNAHDFLWNNPPFQYIPLNFFSIFSLHILLDHMRAPHNYLLTFCISSPSIKPTIMKAQGMKQQCKNTAYLASKLVPWPVVVVFFLLTNCHSVYRGNLFLLHFHVFSFTCFLNDIFEPIATHFMCPSAFILKSNFYFHE